MSRRGVLDVLVVGAGVVGTAAALALARDGRRVALVEARPPPRWQHEQPDLRVYAFAPDNAALLADLGVWPQVLAARAHPYRRMRIWDAAGGDELRFDADALAQPQLGWIVENGLLVDRLWQALTEAGVERHCPARVVALEQGDEHATLSLDSGRSLRARLVVAADGADSPLRTLAGIAVERQDYGQRGLVAYVETERPHEDTCWQRFLPTGPLAFLPCADGRCSIVWTLPEAEAVRLLAVDEAAFRAELARAFD
jgi:3-demethoxyubiquinol 3-hydroxylase